MKQKHKTSCKKNAKTLCTETQNNLHKNTKLIALPKKRQNPLQTTKPLQTKKTQNPLQKKPWQKKKHCNKNNKKNTFATKRKYKKNTGKKNCRKNETLNKKLFRKKEATFKKIHFEIKIDPCWKKKHKPYSKILLTKKNLLKKQTLEKNLWKM